MWNCIVHALTVKALLALCWILRNIQIDWELLSEDFPNLEEKKIAKKWQFESAFKLLV